MIAAAIGHHMALKRYCKCLIRVGFVLFLFRSSVRVCVWPSVTTSLAKKEMPIPDKLLVIHLKFLKFLFFACKRTHTVSRFPCWRMSSGLWSWLYVAFILWHAFIQLHYNFILSFRLYFERSNSRHFSCAWFGC